MVVGKNVAVIRNNDARSQTAFAPVARPAVSLAAKELPEERIRHHRIVTVTPLLLRRLDDARGTDLDDSGRRFLDHVRERIRERVQALSARTRIRTGRHRNRSIPVSRHRESRYEAAADGCRYQR